MMVKDIRYVSFDVFGTLVNRAVPLRQMYGLMGQVIVKNKIAKMHDFVKCRESAEQIARKRYGKNYNLQEIYQSFVPKLSNIQIRQLVELENKFEIINSGVNPRGKKLFDEYRKKYRIIAISDMYLSVDTIEKILKKNGYEIEKIYVSSEKRKSKRERELYDEVVEDLGVKKDQILHIGDAVRSDWLNARFSGMNSHWLRAERNNYFYDFGFNLLGPIMYSFCRWIKSEIGRSRKDKILFVAREGEIIRKFYTALYGEGDEKIIYLSRKSILVGACGVLLEKYTIPQIIGMISLKRNETFGDFLRRLGLEADSFTEELKEDRIDKNGTLDEAVLEDFFKKHRNKILRKLKARTEIFNQYLQDSLSENNLLIDIGWKGSMQNLLAKYLSLVQSSKRVKGLYFGCMDKEDKKGFLFEGNDMACQETLNYSGLLEVILMPEHGSVLSYRKQEEKTVPVFDKCEFSKESMKKINRIQEGAVDFITKMKEFGNDLVLDIESTSKKLSDFGNFPKLSDIRRLGEIDFYDNGQKYYLVKVDWRDLKTSFLDCRWKTAFLRQIMKINLPYDKIVISLRRIGDRDA